MYRGLVGPSTPKTIAESLGSFLDLLRVQTLHANIDNDGMPEMPKMKTYRYNAALQAKTG